MKVLLLTITLGLIFCDSSFGQRQDAGYKLHNEDDRHASHSGQWYKWASPPFSVQTKALCSGDQSKDVCYGTVIYNNLVNAYTSTGQMVSVRGLKQASICFAKNGVCPDPYECMLSKGPQFQAGTQYYLEHQSMDGTIPAFKKYMPEETAREVTEKADATVGH